MFVRFLPFVLLLIPLAEISVFILVGQYIGLVPTLALIFLTAILGALLLRIQGFGLLGKLTSEANAGRIPSRELIHGAMIVVAGIFLITPGFITDTVGFLLFVPAFRDLVWSLLKKRVTVFSSVSGFSGESKSRRQNGPTSQTGPVVDLDDAEFRREGHENSPWSGKDIDRLP